MMHKLCCKSVKLHCVETLNIAFFIWLCIINCYNVSLPDDVSVWTRLEPMLLSYGAPYLSTPTSEVTGTTVTDNMCFVLVCFIKPSEHCWPETRFVSLYSPSARDCFKYQLKVKPVDDKLAHKVLMFFIHTIHLL